MNGTQIWELGFKGGYKLCLDVDEAFVGQLFVGMQERPGSTVHWSRHLPTGASICTSELVYVIPAGAIRERPGEK